MRFPCRHLRFFVPPAMAILLASLAPNSTQGGQYGRGQAWSEARYARVTLTNQSDVDVTFRIHWPHETGQRMTLRPGQVYTAETTFPAGTIQPDLIIRYEEGDWDRRERLELPSGHVAPYTDNPGRVYDFWRVRTPFGPKINLRPR